MKAVSKGSTRRKETTVAECQPVDVHGPEIWLVLRLYTGTLTERYDRGVKEVKRGNGHK